MSVRRSINRYCIEPFGDDFDSVLKRGKAFHKDEPFMMVKYGHTWSALRLPSFGSIPSDARVFKKTGRFWCEVGV